ncbi:hypothetical protein DITRI_Ditri03aG0001800 [Diplodiscus trichospermus]
MDLPSITIQEPPARMDPQGSDDILTQHIVARIEKKIKQCRQQTPSPPTYSICPFPDFLVENLGRDSRFYVHKLMDLRKSTKRCYTEKIVMTSDDELVNMMLLDGSFMVELFRQYEEGNDVTRPWHLPTLIADLLKLENQLPFFILEELYIALTLPPFRYAQLQNSTPQTFTPLVPLESSSLTRNTATAKQTPSLSFCAFKPKREAAALCRNHALKIPPVAIDDLTSTILVNCVALEQCLPDQSKHFTAYVCFMNCLMKQPEDVGYLRSVDIITRVALDDKCFINMLSSVGRNVGLSVRDSYLWKQLREIHSFYNSYWASIRHNLLHYNNMMLYCSVLQIAVGILTWRLSGK